MHRRITQTARGFTVRIDRGKERKSNLLILGESCRSFTRALFCSDVSTTRVTLLMPPCRARHKDPAALLQSADAANSWRPQKCDSPVHPSVEFFAVPANTKRWIFHSWGQSRRSAPVRIDGPALRYTPHPQDCDHFYATL